VAEALREGVTITNVSEGQRITRGILENVVRVEYRVKGLGPFTLELVKGEFTQAAVNAAINRFADEVLSLPIE